MAKPNLLNVKEHLLRIERVLTDILERNGKDFHGTQLAPIDSDELRSINFVNKAILRKHKSKKTRKDIRIES